MRIRHRARGACIALIGAGLVLASSASEAMRVEFHPDALASVGLAPGDPGFRGGGTGFDNSTLMLAPDFEIDDQWLTAGVPLLGEMFAFELAEIQTLRDATQTGAPGQPLNVTDPWISRVDWTATNTTGRAGRALLFVSGLEEFVDPANPSVAAPVQYLPSEVGILKTEDLSVARYRGQSGDFFYLAFLIEDFSQPVDLSFEYEVTRDILGLGTADFGTPILQVNGFFLPVPEPSASLMLTVGLLGLAQVGRRRARCAMPRTRRWRWRWTQSACVVAGVLVLGAASSAETRHDRTRLIELRAARLAAAGQCVEMLDLARAAPEPARSSAALLRLGGNCLIELGRYDEALAWLGRARAADATLTDLDLLTAIASYHLEDLDAAYDALERARGNTARTAELDLYTGLVLLRRNQPREAALALERARSADPEAVEPVASYYAALAWYAERERDRARSALSRLQAVDPEGPWARQASQALGTEVGLDPYWARLTLGAEYDSNVRLAPAGDFPDQDDFRAVWVAEGGARLFEQEDWSAGLVGSYSGSANVDLHKFDTHYPVIGAWLDRRFGERDLLRLRYDVGYAWVDYAPFLFAQDARAAWLHVWQRAGSTELFVAGEFNDYEFEPVVVIPPDPVGVTPRDRDRSGDGILVGIDHRVPLGDGSTVGRGGYTYQRYWAVGSEWDYDSHGFFLGLSVLLPAEIVFDVEGGYAYRPHRNPSTFPEPDGSPPSTSDRRDHIYSIDASLEKDLSERWSVSTAYHFIHSNSNSGFFDYDRHIVGAYVTLSLP